MSEAVMFETRGRLGLIVLNRPRALNALTTDMCIAVRNRLQAWADDEAIAAVAVEAEGDKAFCAGGDVVKVARAKQAGEPGWADFFWHEYRMNREIAAFPKPYISLIDGISMGGGLGISVHGSHRVVTEKGLFAMPETGLGLFPDVGGGWFLPRCPGRLGQFLALTGYRCGQADSLYVGYATHAVSTETVDALRQGLEEGQAPDTLLADLSMNPGTAPLEQDRQAIDRHFSGDRVEDILESLANDGSEWAARQHKRLSTMSPTSLKLTCAQMAAGAKAASVDEVLQMEYRLVVNLLNASPDFFEGVRALLVDKDKSPRWRPDGLSAVPDGDIEKLFDPLGDDELHFRD